MSVNITPSFFARILPWILLIFLSTGISKAEGSIDSLKQVWSNPSVSGSSRFGAILAYYLDYGFAYPDSVIALTHYHLDLARQKNRRAEMAEALDNRALAYYVLGKPDSSISLLNEALKLVEQMNDSVGLARLSANMGNIYLSESNYQDAVRSYSLSLAILKEKHMESVQADVLNNLGLVYYEMK